MRPHRFHVYEPGEPAWLLPDGGPRVRVVIEECASRRTSRGDAWRVTLREPAEMADGTVRVIETETFVFGDQLEPLDAVERLAELA